MMKRTPWMARAALVSVVMGSLVLAGCKNDAPKAAEPAPAAAEKTVAAEAAKDVKAAPAETTQTNQPQAAADVLPETAYGTYKGMMPCADCSGIRTEFILDPKGLYTMNQVYEGTRDGSSQTFSEGGTYTTKGDVVTLATGNQVKVEKDQIRFLDADGKVIDGEIGQYYILKKDAK